MKFHSKIDAWLALTVAGSVLAVLVAAAALGARAGVAGLPVVLALLALGAGLPLWLLCATHYRVQGGTLRVRSGPFRWNIPLSAITRVTPTRSVLSSPALSLDRLRIEYGPGRAVLVSPRDREGFLRALEAAE